jgi:1-acyl-sn-glycerol-3-phosphate acyltransferase
MRIRVEGEAPQGRFFLVANHQGYTDIMLLGSQVHAAFVAKADLKSWPLLGTIFASADTIFIDRRRRKDLLRVITVIEKALDRNLGILLFPEGTSGRGDCVLPFKPALLQLPVSQGFPVYYAALTYTTGIPESPAQETVCWWGDTSFVPHIMQLLRLPGFDATIRFGREPIACADRKELAGQLHEAMSQTFTPAD